MMEGPRIAVFTRGIEHAGATYAYPAVIHALEEDAPPKLAQVKTRTKFSGEGVLESIIDSCAAAL
jgi:hypothetical protein